MEERKGESIMTTECSEPKRECPWGGDKFEEFGGMKRAIEDQGRELSEIKRDIIRIKNSMSDSNVTLRSFGKKLDAALNGGANGRKINKTAVAGGGAAGAGIIGIIYGTVEIIKAWLKARGG